MHSRFEHKVVFPESGVGRIAVERNRQVNEKGWTPEHDRREHEDESLILAACALAMEAYGNREMATSIGRMGPEWVDALNYYASDKYAHAPERLLEIAGALIAVELDRRAIQPPT